jgi:hypothetical protein
MAFKPRKGYAKLFWLPAISNKSAPTQAEPTAGTLIATTALADIAGLTQKTQFIEIPNFASLQTPKISGEKKADDTTLTFYEDDTTNPISTLLAEDTAGFILASPFGATVATSKVDVYPATVASNDRQWTAGNEAAKYAVGFAITSLRIKDAVMAA